MASQTIQIKNSVNESLALIRSVITIINGKIQTEEEKSLKWIYRYEKADVDMYTNLSSDNQITTIKTIAIHPSNDKNIEDKVLDKFNSTILENILIIPVIAQIAHPIGISETITIGSPKVWTVNAIKEVIESLDGELLTIESDKIEWLCPHWPHKREIMNCVTELKENDHNETLVTTTISHPKGKSSREESAIETFKHNLLFLFEEEQELKENEKFQETNPSQERYIVCPHCKSNLLIPKNISNSPLLHCNVCGNDFQNLTSTYYKAYNEKMETNTYSNSNRSWIWIVSILLSIFIIGKCMNDYSNGDNSSKNVFITEYGYYGAYTKEDFNRYVRYSNDGDMEAVKQLLYSAKITPIPGGREAHLIKSNFSTVKIRLKGQTTEIWTFTEAINFK